MARARVYRRLTTLALVTLAACKDAGPQPGEVAVVTLRMPGASAADAETQVLAPVEATVAQMKDVYAMRGRAFEGGVTLDVTLRRGADVKATTKAVRDAVANQTQLPKSVTDVWASVRVPTAVIARIGDHPKALLAAQRALERLPGIAGVAACGIREGRLELALVPSTMTANGLTTEDIVITLKNTFEAGRRASRDEIADTVVGAGGVRSRDAAVITERSEARCLVEGAHDPKLPALFRVGVRSARDREAVEKTLSKAGLVVVKDATTVAAGGRPRKVTLVTGPVGPVVEAVILGDDVDALGDDGRSALAAMRTLLGVTTAWCEGCELATEMKLDIDRDAAATRKLDVEKIARVVHAATGGERVTTYYDGETDVDVVLGVEEGGAQWAQMPIRSDDGKIFPLSEVVHATETRSSRDLLHIDGHRAVAVYVRANAKTSAAALLSSVKAAAPGTRVRVVPAGSVDIDSW